MLSRRTPMRRRAFGGAAAVIALCTSLACGSTLQQTGVAGGSDNLSVGGDSGLPGATTGPTTASAPGQLATSNGGTASRHSGDAAVGSLVTGSHGTVLAPGNAPLYIGVVDQRNDGAADSGLGASNSDPGNFKADYNVMIKYINAHGGIAGHPLKPVFAYFDAASSESISTQEQRACDTWTHDNHVFAILVGQSELLKACAQRAGVVQLSIEESSTDSTGFARYPAFVEITAVGLDREGPATVNGLNQLHYFSGVRSNQVGIVTWDLPQYHHAIQYGYLPVLRRLGINVSSDHQRFLHVPDTAGDVATTSTDARAAAFKFARDGVTHVLILDGHAGIATGGVVHLEFMLNAEGLHYRPRYGLNETAAYSAGATTYPKAQQHGAVGIAWGPGADGSTNPDPGTPYATARARCMKIMSDGGIDASNPNADANLVGVCDELFFMQQVGSHISGAISTASFINGVARLGTSYQPAGTYATSFVGRRDGASQARNVAFDDGCTCYRYVSGRYGI